MATPRKASVQRAKLAAYYKRGTCGRCGTPIVTTPSLRCRRCEAIESAARAELAIAVKATDHFHYWLTCRKKAPGSDGRVARAVLGSKTLRGLVGLQAIAEASTERQLNVRELEAAWAASEIERRAESAG